MKFLRYIVFLGLLQCSEYEVKSDPLADYELFFNYLNNDYSYKDKFDLEAIRKKYLPQLQKNPTQKTLANVLVSIEYKELQDPHVYFSGEEKPYDLAPEVKKYTKPGADLINPKLEAIEIIKEDHFYTYGLVKKYLTIGYLYIKSFNRQTGGSNALGIPKGIDAIETYIKDLKDKGITTMIVDIRSDAGGSAYIPLWLAKRFANRKALYMIADYPVADGFKTAKWYVAPEGKEGFREGKIALLTNGNTCSGGEMFVLAMLQRKNLVHIGSATEGCAGNIADKDLANGWNLRITNGKTAKADGTEYFKVGIIPSVIAKNDRTPTDKVIEKAIEELRK